MERVEGNRETDAVLFHELLYAGEFVTKVTVLALVAAIDDDRENYCYRFLHTLVRADGVGDWAAVLDQICVGPAAENLSTGFTNEVGVFTQSVDKRSWQHRAVVDLQEVLLGVEPDVTKLAKKVNLRLWFPKV